VAEQCRDRRADPVLEKHVGTFCEYFELARRAYRPSAEVHSREASARDQLKKLLGD
jgi:DNA-directed RNA polymerase specialized sigma24 family protein